MKSRLLLDVIVGKSSAIFELLTGEDKTLLIGRDALFVLNFSLDIINGVRWLDLKGNGLTSEGLNEDLHATSESKHEMKSGLLLNVVVRQSSAVFKLLTGEDKTLLIGRDALFVLDFGFDVVNSV